MSVPLHRLTGSKAVRLMRNNELTCEHYVRALLAHIRQREPSIRAWVYLDDNLVLARARELDQIPVSDRGSLHGLPVGVKDVILTKDMPTQYNSRICEKQEPDTIDAAAITTLRACGALIFGKTTTTEFAATKQGNWHQNLTANAVSPNHTPGGSSSGSGAAVVDYHVPIALGTQTGGSIVRPASYNGCYGYKPTWAAISREGLAQWSVSNDTCGFFARSIEDLQLLADAFRIADDEPVPTSSFSIRGAKIGVCKTPVWPKAGPGTRAAMSKAQEILSAEGARVEEIELPNEFDNVIEWHAAILGGEGRTSFLGQYLQAKEKLHESIIDHVENTKGFSRKQQLHAYDNCARLRPIWDEISAKYDVVITPSIPDEAPQGLELTGDMSFNSIWTIMQCPVLNVPGFVGNSGLPVGLSLVSPRYTDRRLLWVAEAIGTLFERDGGWQAKAS